MKTLLTLLALWPMCLFAGPTNAPVLVTVISTNTVRANPDFRTVNGQVYYTPRSERWQNTLGEVITKSNGVVVVQTYEVKSRTYPSLGGGGGWPGGGLGRDFSSGQTVKWTEYGKFIAITNAPDYADIAAGQNLGMELIRTGTVTINGKPLELWDRGQTFEGTFYLTNQYWQKPRAK